MIRAVCDPGVLIAGLISSDGLPASLIRVWINGAFQLVVSPRLIEELEEVLLREKFRRWMSENDAMAFVAVVRLVAQGVGDPATIEALSRDPDDDYLIALAVASDAHVLVTGDDDLLSIIDPPVPILAPRRFRALIGES